MNVNEYEDAMKKIEGNSLCIDFYANTITTYNGRKITWSGLDFGDFYEVLCNFLEDGADL